MKRSIALILAVSTLLLAGCSTTRNGTHWEYKLIDGKQTEASLNQLADDGWSVVGLNSYGGYLLKRPKR